MNKNFILQRDQQILILEGKHYSKQQVLELAIQYRNDTSHLADLFSFLEEWFNEEEVVAVRTSGSTGIAKVMMVEKERMIQSACLTCSFLALHFPHTTLLCMPLQFIGAKMLVVRALVASLDLYCVPSSAHPLQDFAFSPSFVPMTPQQAWGCLETPEEVELLRGIRHILLGGMAVTADLQARLADFPHAIWSSYGMTETLSHIALRKVNGADASDWFTPFDGVTLSLSDKSALIIHAPAIDILTTNDMAEILPDGRFRILGRIDNIINSGGVKIQIETVEEKLHAYISSPFQITALPHTILGEQLVLLLDMPCQDWETKCDHLPKFWKPKRMFVVPALPLTDSGKPDRHKARELAKQYCQ